MKEDDVMSSGAIALIPTIGIVVVGGLDTIEAIFTFFVIFGIVALVISSNADKVKELEKQSELSRIDLNEKIDNNAITEEESYGSINHFESYNNIPLKPMPTSKQLKELFDSPELRECLSYFDKKTIAVGVGSGWYHDGIDTTKLYKITIYGPSMAHVALDIMKRFNCDQDQVANITNAKINEVKHKLIEMGWSENQAFNIALNLVINLNSRSGLPLIS